MTGVEIRRLVYLQQFTANTIPIFPAYAIMFNDRSGLSTSQISALFIICNIAAMVSEVPTGVLADHLSRRVVMLFSTLLTGLTFVTWLVFPSFLGYSAGFVLWGVGFAMASGALQAYLFDQLKLLGRLDEFTKAFSRSRAFSYGGMFLGYGAAIVIGIEHYELLLGLSIAACAISIVVTLLLPKDRFQRQLPVSEATYVPPSAVFADLRSCAAAF